MSGKSLVDQIRHYQKDIERCPENSERMIRCIQRLYVLPIQVLHLQETGVGRSVNSLRKYKGEVGEAAKALVAKWKAMVAAEESSDDSNDKIKSNAGDYKLSKSSISPVKVEPKYEKPVVKVEPKAEKPIVKTEPKAEKQDHSSSRDKYCSKDRSSTRDNLNSKEKSTSKSHHSLSRHHSETHSSSRSHSSSMKRSHSSSEKNHTSDRKSSSHQNHKSSHNEKRHTSDEETPPSPKKHKKHHSHSRNHSHSKEETVESEEEADEEEANESNDDRSEAGDSSSDSEKESSEESDNSSVEEELTDRLATLEEEEEEEQESDNSSSDHRHRSKHKSSYHKHVKSSHSDKNKENRNSHKSSTRDSSKTSKDSKSSKHLDELIKENEKKIKKEKEDFEVPKYIPTKIVKLERNEDGSIDSGSGASFADALLGMDSFAEPKKKKKCSSKEPSSNSNYKTSSSSKSSSSSSSHKKQHSQSSSSSSKDKLKEMSSKPKSIDELVETPDLLTKKVKLEALDLDISSTLPEINPNYKPLPHVPESSRRQSKMSEEDTMFSIMTTKNQRTKVYSGNKVYQNTVPSLFNLCIQLLYENIDAVEYTGGVPYNLLKPLLERLNSDQLYVIEHFNPYLIEDTDNLWKFHCSKDFRSQKRQDMESWRDLYLRCIEERERKLKAVTANISHSMAKSTPVRQAKLAYVDSVVKPPRNVARKQAKYGTGSGSSSSSKSTPNNNKQDIVNKAIVGGHTPGVSAKDVVPPPPAPRAVHHSTPAVLKKKKAPLMQKALQFIKGNRYKR